MDKQRKIGFILGAMFIIWAVVMKVLLNMNIIFSLFYPVVVGIFPIGVLFIILLRNNHKINGVKLLDRIQ